MPRKHTLTIVAALALVATGGCAHPGPPECEATPALHATGGTTWLVRRVLFPHAQGEEPLPGFDLDGLDSGAGNPAEDATCEEYSRDYASALDERLRGVDNNLQLLIDTANSAGEVSLQGELDRAVGEGRLRWAIRVGPAEAREDGSRRALELLAIDPSETIELGPDGRVSRPLRATALTRVEDACPLGDSLWGRTERDGLPLAGEVPFLPFDALRVSALGISAESTTTLRANLGGSFPVDALIDAAVRATFESARETIRSVLEGLADIEPRADASMSCSRVSAGFELELVPVQLLAD